MYRYYIVNKNWEGELSYPNTISATALHIYGQNGVSFDCVKDTVYGYFECEEALDLREIASFGLIEGPVPTYYPINEDLARRAKEMMSFDSYKQGSKTASYRLSVDEVSLIAHLHKKRVDPTHHEKIDRLADTYARKLAENMNSDSAIGSRCPSVMIAGGSNFPVRKKQKQVAAWERNNEEWKRIQGLISKIRSVGTGGISGDDPNALEKLRAERDRLVKHQELMKAANAAIRMKDTEEGDRRLAELGFDAREIVELRKPDFAGRIGYPAYELSNNSANIRRYNGRIAELEKRASEPAPEGWEFDGGKVVINQEVNRVQIIFDGKPDPDVRSELKGEGFRWAPSQGAWQRQLTDNALRAVKRLKCVAKADGGGDGE